MTDRLTRNWRRLATLVKPPLYAIIKRRYDGAANLPPPGTGFIIAANHISNIDWLALGAALYDQGLYPAILAKSSLFKVALVGRVLRAVGQIPVERGTAKAGQALVAAAAALEQGRCVMFFPEGTLTKDPELWPMQARSGVGRLALSSGVPVIPVGIWGTEALMPQGKVRLRPLPRKVVRIRAGQALDLTDLREASSDADAGAEASAARQATDRIMAQVRVIVGELRGQEPPAEVYWPGGAARPDSSDRNY